MKVASWLLLAALCLVCDATSVSAQILPAGRTTTWAPGLPGGVPTRTTVCAQLTAASYGNGAQDASAAIQAALDACPAGQVVALSAGTFTTNKYLLIHTGVTLRGAGAGVTTLRKTNGARARLSPMQPIDPGTYQYDAQPIVIIGPQRWVQPDSSTSQNLLTDGAQGDKTVTVANAAGFAAGQFVLLDELSGATWQATPAGFPGHALVWQSDRVAWNMHLPQQQWQDDNTYSDAAGPYDINNGTRTQPNSVSWFARTDRPTNEIKEIASVSGATITLTTPLHIAYRASHAAQLTRYTGSNVHVKYAGVESLTTVGGADGQIRFQDAAYSWAKNVEVTQWIGEGFAANGAFRVEIRDSYVHDGSWPEPGGAGYALSFSAGSSEVLVENNIFINACKEMVVRSSGAGSVIAYNYADDAWNYDNPGWVEVGVNGSHMAGSHHILFEGNYSQNVDSDYTHGNAIALTFLRNWLSGQRRSFADSSNARTVGLAYGSWWDSFVGNVLGRPGEMSGWIYEAPAMSGTNANWGDKEIWKLGYDPERWSMFADPQTLATVVRDGNWDFVTNSVHWHNTPNGFVIPDSMYLSGKPAFFGSYTWPWVDPLSGSTYTLPAKARYDAGTPNDASSTGEPTPEMVSVSPSAGFGLTQTFAAVFRDAGGAGRLQQAYFLVSSSAVPTSIGGVQIFYDSSANLLYLRNDTDTAFGAGVRPGSAGTLSNSRVSLDLAHASVAKSATDLTITLPLTFATAFTGPKNVYLFGVDASGTQSPAYQLLGSFTVGTISSRIKDLVVYRPGNGTWYTLTGPGATTTATNQSMVTGDLPLTADFDGDGTPDLVVYRPGSGTWSIRYSSTGSWTRYTWGQSDDVPIPGDFDGDHKADLAVYRPSTGTWYVSFSSGNYSNWTSYRWGQPGDVPLHGDFDGDGKADLVVYRSSDSTWYICFSSGNYSSWTTYRWGAPNDVAVPEDFDGDGKSDVAVYRPSEGIWYVLFSSNGSWTSYQFGSPETAPVLGDFDGDGKADLAVWQASSGVWYFLFSASGYNSSTWQWFRWGQSGDVPMGAETTVARVI